MIDLVKTANMNWLYLSRFPSPHAQTRSCMKVIFGCTINYRLYYATRKKADFTREQPPHRSKVPPKPNFVVIL